MGYRTQLWTNDEPDAVEFSNHIPDKLGQDFLEVGGMIIPLLWSASFACEHIHCGENVTEETIENELSPIYCSFDAPVQEALNNLNRRRAALLKLIPPNLALHFERFHERLSASRGMYLHLDLHDIVQVDNTAASWNSTFSQMLADLDQPITRLTTGWMRYFRGTGLPHGWHLALIYSHLNKAVLSGENSADPWKISGAGDDSEYDEWQP